MEAVLEGLLTPSQAARRLGFYRTSVCHAIEAGRLPVVRIAGRAFIPVEAVERYAADPPRPGRKRKA